MSEAGRSCPGEDTMTSTTAPRPEDREDTFDAYSHDYVAHMSDSASYSHVSSFIDKADGKYMHVYAFTSDGGDTLTVCRGRASVNVYLPLGTLAALAEAIATGRLTLIDTTTVAQGV